MNLRDAKKLVLKKFRYDPESGLFFYLESKIPKYIGTQAGSVAPNGYVRLKVSGVHVAAHRVAFLFITGEWPSSFVDHIDGDRTNNRWDNLRLCTPSENSRNCAVPHNSASGIRGVSYKPNASKAKPWSVKIKVGGVFKHIGTYRTKDEAIAARLDASAKYHGVFSGQIVRGENRHQGEKP